MKIALISNFAPCGGAREIFKREALLLNNAGHAIFVLSDNVKLENVSRIQNITIPAIHERIKPADRQNIL